MSCCSAVGPSAPVRRALVVAGLDPSAGAGLLIDAFVLARLDFAPSVAATVITAQNSATFIEARPVAADLLGSQIDAVVAEGRFECIKVGAVGSSENALLLARILPKMGCPVVVDPVLMSSSGGWLIGGDLEAIERLCSAATVVTPNADEAARLAGVESVPDVATASEIGRRLALRWGNRVVITGVRHPDSEYAVDVVCASDSAEGITHRLLSDAGDARGTGCMFASGLAAALGSGRSLPEAVVDAQSTVLELLRMTHALGVGRQQVDLRAISRS